jgi:aspartate 1-decarboxylase
MRRHLLKSKIHRALVTDANIDYEGSITIPRDLMAAADLWEHEKVLVASITTGARLETYVIPGESGSGQIVINGGAAHLISTGHLVTIMSWTWNEDPIDARIVLCGTGNKIVTSSHVTH